MENEIKIIREKYKNYIIRCRFEYKNTQWYVLSGNGTANSDWAPSFGVIIKDGKAVAPIEFRKLSLLDAEFIKAMEKAIPIDVKHIGNNHKD